MKTIRENLLTILFLLFILGVGLLNVIKSPTEFSELENRYLSQRPKITREGLMNSGSDGFAQKYEAYFNDQFIARDSWITLKSIVEAMLGKIENNGVAYGKDGYLFGIYRRLDESRLDKNIKIIGEFFNEYPNITARLLLVPSSSEIMQEMLPNNPGNVEQMPIIQSLYEQISSDNAIGVDVYRNFRANASQTLYYKTDHHWTTLGAWHATNAYLSSVQLENISLPFEKYQATYFYGTLFSKAKRFNSPADTITLYDVPVTRVTIDGKPKEGLYDFDKAAFRDKYSIFLWGNNGVTVIENDMAPTRTLLVVKDSFANSMLPFLTNSFSCIVAIDPRHFAGSTSEIIEKYPMEHILILYSLANLASDGALPRILY